MSPDQVSTNLSGESVVLHMSRAVYFGLDVVGTRVWELIQEPRTLAEVAARLEAEFDVTPERAMADLQAFATDLVKNGLADVVTD